MITPRPELRRTPREKRRHAAWITYGTNPTRIPCVVWDLSNKGARLTAAHSSILPEVLTLILSTEGKVQYHCRVVWKKKPHFGVKFVSAEAAERLQLAAAAVPKNTPNWLGPSRRKARRDSTDSSPRVQNFFDLF